MRRFRDLRRSIFCALVIASFGVPQVLIAQPDTLWTRRYDSGYGDYARGIAIDREGNIIVTGKSKIASNRDYLTIKYSP